MMARKDWCLVIAFVLVSAGGLVVLGRATARHDAIDRLEKARSGIASQLGAAQRMLNHAESELASELDNPQADTIRGIYGSYVDKYREGLARVDARLTELRGSW